MVQFARACARDPQSLSPANFDHLRSLGLTEAEVIEIVAMAALAVYANIIADATRMEEDAMLGSL